MNKEKALRVIELAKEIIKAQKELRKLGVSFQISQSLSDAVSFSQGYLVAVDQQTPQSEAK
jgi:hypothetical protein